MSSGVNNEPLSYVRNKNDQKIIINNGLCKMDLKEREKERENEKYSLPVSPRNRPLFRPFYRRMFLIIALLR